MRSNQKIHIATIGKCVGLFGELKLHLHTDFAEQFSTGASFETDGAKRVTITSYKPEKSLVKFDNYPDRNSASVLINQKLYTTIQESIQNCTLKEGEYFWFDMENADVYEKDIYLGKVIEIQRIANTDYLHVQTDSQLVDKSLSKRFLIPYIPQYIDHFDKEKKRVYTKDAYGLLEAS